MPPHCDSLDGPVVRAAQTRARRTTIVLVAAAPTLDPRVRGGVYFGVGPFWWPPYTYGPYTYGWYPGPYYYGAPPVVVVEPPPIYIQRPPAVPQYWYYCAPAQAYYPSVQTCTEPWIKVPASRQ